VGGQSVPHELVIRKATIGGGYELCVKLKEKGHYIGTVKYGGRIIGRPGFTIICLTGKKKQLELKSSFSVVLLFFRQ
jgi:hypothetical protein